MVRTEQASLQWLFRVTSPEGQLVRWLEKLQCYDFTATHRPGHERDNAAALSRQSCWEANYQCCPKQESKELVAQKDECAALPLIRRRAHVPISSIRATGLGPKQLKTSQRETLISGQRVTGKSTGKCTHPGMQCNNATVKVVWSQQES